MMTLRGMAAITLVRSKSLYRQQLAARTKKTATPPDEFELIRRWEAMLDLKGEGVKRANPIKDGSGRIIDYADIVIEGYLSTFEAVTKADRDGDAVEEGAFADTITEFMKNPVLLVDHINMVEYLAGSFTIVKEDKKGLRIRAEVTNSPDMVAVRFKIAEGILKALSMGGIFYYKEDRRTIFKVKLWEGSLVSIPANQDALFQVRSLNDREKKFLKSGGSDYLNFLHAEAKRNQMGLTV